MGLAKDCGNINSTVLCKNLESFWDIVEECHDHCENFADFNGFLLSKVVNEVWGYDTVFSRFSENQQAFCDDFNFLLSRFDEYSNLLRQSGEILGEPNIGGVSDQEFQLVPFWFHCDCGGKVKLFEKVEESFMVGEGNCSRCGRQYSLEFGTSNHPDMSTLASRVSARAVSMNLVFFRGLAPICYVGGAGGAAYLVQAQHVAQGLGILFPPVVVWRPHDEYLGLGQIEALLELREVCVDLGARDISGAKHSLVSKISAVYESLDRIEKSKRRLIEELRKSPNDLELQERLRSVSISQTEMCRSSHLSLLHHTLKMVENVLSISNLMPSVIDYAVNIGVKETSEEWIRHLSEKDSLESDVWLESVLSKTRTWGSIFTEGLELL
jgi:hypothetical protein